MIIRIRVCIILLVFTFNWVYPQIKNRDSLEKVVKTVTDEKEKATTLSLLAETYCVVNYNQAIDYAKRSVTLSRKINFDKGLANAYGIEAFIWINLGENDKALTSLDSAVHYYLKIKDKTGLANTFGYWGLVYYNLGNYNKSLENDLKSLKYFEELNNNSGIAKTLIHIANINLMQNDAVKAENNYKQALGIYREQKNYNGMAHALTGMAHVLQKQNKIKEALAQYRRCIVMFDSLGNKEGSAGAYLGSGRILRLEYKNDEALELFNKALTLYEETGQANKNVETLGAIADVYMEKREYEKAIEYNERFFKKAGEMRAKPYQRDAMEGLARSHAALGNFARAYGYQLLTSRIKDTLYSEERSARMTDMEVKYETEKKEQENKVLQQKTEIQDLELSRKNNLLIGSSLLAVLAILFAYLFVRQNRLAAKQKTIDLEQKVLRSQMNPHFIFNSLIAIQSFIYRSDPKTAGDYLSDFAKLMRLILVNSREEFIPLNKEIETLELYLRLQQLRFDNKFDYKIETDDSVEREEVSIPPMLAQPFIENAIEHGISRIERQGKIDVRFSMAGDLLKIVVTDNGIGITKAMEQKEKSGHRSLATTITEERLSILNRRARKKISLIIEEMKGADGAILGTKIEFAVPFGKD